MRIKFFKFFGISILSLSFCYALLPVAVRQAAPLRCQAWSSRTIVPDAVPARDLINIVQETRVVKIPDFLAARLPQPGLSLPGFIVLSDQLTVLSTNYLLWHEVAHQHQYRRDGVPRFFAKYIFEWHRGLLSGCSFSNAYRAISYELEAQSIAHDYAQALHEQSLSIRHPFATDAYYIPTAVAGNLARQQQQQVTSRTCC